MDEKAFLRRILPHLNRTPSVRFLVPPGDDAAVLKNKLVLSIDGLTDQTHFRIEWARRVENLLSVSLGRLLGWKIMGRALSDLCAMGAVHQPWALVYLGAPDKTTSRFAFEIHKGVQETARRYQCAVVGGDTARSKHLTLVAAVGGQLSGNRPLRRDGARPGDLLCVTGSIGDAGMGLKILLGRERFKKKQAAPFVRRFFQHQPIFKEARILNSESGVRALIDVSDSLQESIEILLDKKLGAIIKLENVPVSPELAALKRDRRWILGTGEDYALLFALHPQAEKRLRRKLKFNVIGQVLKTKKIGYFNQGRSFTPVGYFKHFK